MDRDEPAGGAAGPDPAAGGEGDPRAGAPAGATDRPEAVDEGIGAGGESPWVAGPAATAGHGAVAAAGAGAGGDGATAGAAGARVADPPAGDARGAAASAAGGVPADAAAAGHGAAPWATGEAPGAGAPSRATGEAAGQGAASWATGEAAGHGAPSRAAGEAAGPGAASWATGGPAAPGAVPPWQAALASLSHRPPYACPRCTGNRASFDLAWPVLWSVRKDPHTGQVEQWRSGPTLATAADGGPELTVRCELCGFTGPESMFTAAARRLPPPPPFPPAPGAAG